jgi:formiminoglutamate deiminase
MYQVLKASDPTLPVHIHIAEQQKEVNDCLNWSGQRPISWLYDHLDINARWCLIHATHADAYEVTKMAHSGAVAGLCPTTEANLGDGIFPGVDYLAQEGRWGIGSDSHVSLNVVEELRWLEYGQRLRDQRRNRLIAQGQTRVGDVLYTQALSGGAQAAACRWGNSRSVIAPTGWCSTIRTLIWLRQATTRCLTAGCLPGMPVRFAMFMLAALRALSMGFIRSNRPPRLIFCNCCNSFLRSA